MRDYSTIYMNVNVSKATWLGLQPAGKRRIQGELGG